MVSSADTPAISTNALPTALRTPASSFCPKSWLTTTPLPMHSPVTMLVSRIMTENALPTAARAISPQYRPTTKVSTRL